VTLFPAGLDWHDFLARPRLPSPPADVLDALAGSPLLITGAGGSIGSALALRFAGLACSRVLLLDHSDANLYRLQQAWEEAKNAFPGRNAKAIFILGDAGDCGALEEIFAAHAPRVVFHAAAYKHVPILEGQPLAAISNNIFSTETVTAVAAKHNARVILVSTDKAVQPTSVMGATKQVAEKIVLMAGGTALRMGNVLGSSGSVTEVFAHQIAGGGPLTVTDSAASRFFLTTDEAVDLLLQGAAHSVGGTVLAPARLGEYSIARLADFLLRALAPGREIAIRYTGLRPGEKPSELLWDDSEQASLLEGSWMVQIQTSNPHVAQLESDLGNLRTAVSQRDIPAALARLRALAPSYQPSRTVCEVAGNSENLVQI
jgi:FlaA1/EpsC-like NDP-sugar epimerase